MTFKPSTDIMPGIHGESKYLVNSRGIRGDELSPLHTYRILAIGGSTTECNYLDQSEDWTYLLQKKLNERNHEYTVWVGNAGKGGSSTRHHILQMKYLLEQDLDIDAVVTLIGINDLSLRLREGDRYDPGFLRKPWSEEKLALGAFSVLPVGRNTALPFYKRTALWHLLRKCKYRFYPPGQIQDIEGRYMTSWRKYRQNAQSIRDVLPDLSTALEEYSRNINTLIDIAEKRSVRLIFVTQPVLWKPGLSKQLKALLWFGGVGDFRQSHEREYYSVDALAEGIRLYNKTLIQTCAERGIECFDLASILSKDTTVFYDDCHFNESGSEKVAELLARYMLARSPLISSIPSSLSQ